MINIKKINQSDIDIVTSFLSIEKNLNNLFEIGWTEKNFINQLKKNNNLSLGLFEKSKRDPISEKDFVIMRKKTIRIFLIIYLYLNFNYSISNYLSLTCNYFL